MVQLRGFSHPLEFLRSIGVPDCRYRRLRNDPKTISFELLDKLCWELRCTPNELMEWEPDARQVNHEGHPISRLMLSNEVKQLQQVVREIDPKKVSKVLAMLQELEKEE